ncbi:hypothetical protein MW887_007123 [Aspergillus wentii]|nr:hypothetical protein MW887_007123 [Aspergillus wentii]
MSIPTLPNELLMLIVNDLDSQKDLNALLQSNSRLYHTLNDYLYDCNVRHCQSSALWRAAKHGSESTLQRLIEAGADVRWKSPFLPTPQLGGKTGSTPSREIKHQKEHPISYSAMNGHEGFSSKLLDHGVDVDYKDPDGRTPLSLAARAGHLAVVKMLTERGACQQSRDIFNLTPIGNAASQGQYVVEDFLLHELHKSEMPSETIEAEMKTMLMYAARRGDDERIRQMMDMNVDVNCQTHIDSCTPLCAAAKDGHADTVKLLLEHGADPNFLIGGSREHTPLECAVDSDRSDRIIPLLIEHGADARKSGGRAIYYALLQGKTNEFQLLVDCNAKLTTWSPWSSLTTAITGGINSITDKLFGNMSASQDEMGKVRSAGRFAEEALLDYLKTCLDTQQ